MKLSLCIVHYYAEDALKRFLHSLQAYPPSCSYEVVIIDNGSDSKALATALMDFDGQLRLFNPGRNVGFGAGLNKAVQEARGEYVLLGNSDIEVQKNSLEALLHFAQEHPKVGIVGPQLFYHDGRLQDSRRRFPQPLDLIVKRLGLSLLFPERMRRYLMRDIPFAKTTTVDWLVGAVLLMKKDRFLELGGFDERFFLFFEDTDLCRRARKAGYEVWYEPQARFLHRRVRLSESDVAGLFVFKKTFWIHLASAVKYFSKWKGKKGTF